ncbi:MAG: enoyl-CoA hydratase/isomerase family protein, partial [Alphaproteobacteria bacterium]
MRSASVDLPWSIWAMIEKLRMFFSGVMGRLLAPLRDAGKWPLGGAGGSPIMRNAQARDAQCEGEREKGVDAGEIRVAHDGPVTFVTIARKAVRNALDTAMRAKLRAAFEAAAAREETRAVILTGAGDKAFCAGQDVRELAALDGAGAQDWVRDMQALFACVRSFEKPVVCALNGVAAGLGFQLALMADVRIAAASARMGQTEINLGLASMSGPWIMREV